MTLLVYTSDGGYTWHIDNCKYEATTNSVAGVANVVS